MKNTTQLALVALAALSLGLTACSDDSSKESSAGDAGSSESTTKVENTEEAVAEAAFAAIKKADAKTLVSMMSFDKGNGPRLKEGYEGMMKEDANDRLKEFSERFDLSVEEAKALSLKEFAAVILQKEVFERRKDFETRIKEMGQHSKGKVNDGVQFYHAKLPNGADIEIGVVKDDEGNFKLCLVDIDDWNGPDPDAKKTETKKTETKKTETKISE